MCERDGPVDARFFGVIASIGEVDRVVERPQQFPAGFEIIRLCLMSGFVVGDGGFDRGRGGEAFGNGFGARSPECVSRGERISPRIGCRITGPGILRSR